NLNAQNPLEDEQVIVSPDLLHIYFHGCSPHTDRVRIINNTLEELVINRFYADNFQVECLYYGENIAEEGFILPIGDTLDLNVYAIPIYAFDKAQQDVYGDLIIDTDFGIYTITLFYETTVGTHESQASFSLFPNPAKETITISGDGLGKVTLYNVLGQEVEVFESAGSDIKISSTQYQNGIYFVKTDSGITKRIIIAH
ncbi:MAG: T9SS type A sorting domain-containing protein, partial [Bacteroidaceae bacterium]|nr:T9SS type A sorting domain-containing protein [Bacteroidaceae bacterium]